jgi:hypothetical protein
MKKLLATIMAAAVGCLAMAAQAAPPAVPQKSLTVMPATVGQLDRTSLDRGSVKHFLAKGDALATSDDVAGLGKAQVKHVARTVDKMKLEAAPYRGTGGLAFGKAQAVQLDAKAPGHCCDATVITAGQAYVADTARAGANYVTAKLSGAQMLAKPTGMGIVVTV